MQHQTKRGTTLQSGTSEIINSLGVSIDTTKHSSKPYTWQVNRLATEHGFSIPVAALVSELSGTGVTA